MNRPTSDQREAARHAPADARSLVRQRWNHLLFLHWTVDREALQATLPPGLYADTYAGAGWLGLSTYAVSEARIAGLPAWGKMSEFLGLNVSTCVFDENGVPGLWFYSLDLSQPLAAWINRTLFALPARRSDLLAKFGDTSELSLSNPAGTETFRWTTDHSPGQIASRGSLEIFLLERYHYYVVKSGRLLRGSVARSPYLWSKVRVDELSTAPTTRAGFANLSAVPQHACTVDPVDVRVIGWPVAV
jgi:uncharacterized protein YqjF (DUF2071 family)